MLAWLVLLGDAWRSAGRQRHDGVYEALQPDSDAILRSEVFPGLWLPADALWDGDLTRMIAVLQQGLSSPEHAAFVTDLQGRMG